ncbi:Hypothetical Protein FCC1311_025732 [Hondaea fermentalgiana]|uniref:Uncharacterized protein n=1 Tax=Hondaea fermentalgiana TaxID=2315210 RepID=A0A2R5G5M1_9STRA|nr:Hypothetical Protein FCC1311_025732 [Hondaea fermentalgiana]|eukprot:GBG26352.1 Hypothetical Protein FCC1311_025732 [Hondaea fermentalgiana]
MRRDPREDGSERQGEGEGEEEGRERAEDEGELQRDASPRLEVTLEPATSIFRDEGGKFNYLCAFFVLRSGAEGLPGALEAVMAEDGSVPLKLELLYEDGSLVPVRQGKPALQIFGSAGTQKPEEGGAVCNCRDRLGSVRYRILKLSRNHDGKQFRLKISLDGVDEDVVAPAITRPTSVLSKRKWLRANERAPEGSKRKRLEELAAKQNVQLAQEAASPRATGAQLHVPVRELAGLSALEAGYPQPVNIHMYVSAKDGAHSHAGNERRSRRGSTSMPSSSSSYAVRGESASASLSRHSSVFDSEDEDPEYVPRAMTSSGRRVISSHRGRQASLASTEPIATQSMLPGATVDQGPPAVELAHAAAASLASGAIVSGSVGAAATAAALDPQTTAILRKVLDQLQVLQGEIKRYNETVVETTRRIDVLETENRSLKRQLSDIAAGAMDADEERMYKRSKQTTAPLVSLSRPLSLPRSHSLNMSGDVFNIIGADDDGMTPVLSDIEAVFSGSSNPFL